MGLEHTLIEGGKGMIVQVMRKKGRGEEAFVAYDKQVEVGTEVLAEFTDEKEAQKYCESWNLAVLIVLRDMATPRLHYVFSGRLGEYHRIRFFGAFDPVAKVKFDVYEDAIKEGEKVIKIIEDAECTAQPL